MESDNRELDYKKNKRNKGNMVQVRSKCGIERIR